MNTSQTPPPFRAARWNGTLAAALAVTGIAHIPATGHHMAEAPYLGAAFVAFTVACIGLLLALASGSTPRVHAAAAALSAGAVAAYVLTRSVALPGLEHDLGVWLDPLGVVSVAAEAVATFAALRLLAAGTQPVRVGAIAGERS